MANSNTAKTETETKNTSADEQTAPVAETATEELTRPSQLVVYCNSESNNSFSDIAKNIGITAAGVTAGVLAAYGTVKLIEWALKK